MTNKQIIEGVKQIEAMFGREYPSASIGHIVSSLENEEMSSLIKAIRFIEEGGDFRFLPAPKDLIRIVREHASKQRDKEHEDKLRDNRKNRDANLPSNSKLAKAAVSIVNLTFSGKATRRQILEMYRQADAAFPGAGWAESGAKLQRHYESKNLDLDKVPCGMTT